MPHINPVTVVLILIFLIPVISGAVRPFTRERIFYSFEQLFDYIELIAGLLISIYIIREVYFEHDTFIFKEIYELIPDNIKSNLAGRDVMVYLLNVPLVLLLFILIMRPLKVALFRFVIEPLAERLFKGLCNIGPRIRFVLGGMVQLPKALFIVLVAGLLLNFYSYYFTVPQLSKWISDSGTYNFIYNKALLPILNSNIAKRIPVLLNDSFKGNSGTEGAENDGSPGESLAQRIANSLTGSNVRVIEYFNGVTLDEAIRSNSEIDNMARSITEGSKDDYTKAQKIYKWISKNLEYDTKKAERVSVNSQGISSGSIVAFETRKGICFDYSCLFISMCRAVNLKVRLVTGLGYSGVTWGDHAWNQVYSESRGKWINVDTTFGTVSNYFDKANFEIDHKYAEVQGEW
jgi:hypothetical protein